MRHKPCYSSKKERVRERERQRGGREGGRALERDREREREREREKEVSCGPAVRVEEPLLSEVFPLLGLAVCAPPLAGKTLETEVLPSAIVKHAIDGACGSHGFVGRLVLLGFLESASVT